jgi:hypothetical protein
MRDSNEKLISIEQTIQPRPANLNGDGRGQGQQKPGDLRMRGP